MFPYFSLIYEQFRGEKESFRSHWEETLKGIKTEAKNSGIWYRAQVTCPVQSQ
jgi:hypothetical protein